MSSFSIRLYTRCASSDTDTGLPAISSSVPFSIPLTEDTPQCVHLGQVQISHFITATLNSDDPSQPLLTRSIEVHTKRFTAHGHTCQILPHSVSLSNPTPVNVEVPRTTFRLDEPIPVYVTIPPPDRNVILIHGFTLRSVRAELIRTAKILDQGSYSTSDSSISLDIDDTYSSSDSDDSESVSSAGLPPSAEFSMDSYMTSSTSINPHISRLASLPQDVILARSGSSCRFHPSRSVKLRFILHNSYPRNSSPDELHSQLADLENNFADDDDSQCATISQSTLLCAIEFGIQIRVTFFHASTRSERTFSTIIPVTILPPAAPLPEVDPSLDSAYRKKHDKPPLKTVRREDSDTYPGEYENQAGPSAIPNGAPPPFEEAPPPFFSVGEASSSRLPTFLESESEIIVPSEDHPAASTSVLPPRSLSIEGEGVLFGFPATERYDGHSDDVIHTATPPPPLEMVQEDADVTDLAGLVNQPRRAMDALNLVLEEHEERQRREDELLPPPPPPMDDPSDPPPSIDSEFHSSDPNPPPDILNPDFRTRASPSPGSLALHSSPPAIRSVPLTTEPPITLNMSNQGTSIPEVTSGISPSHAPPPYLNTSSPGDTEHTTRPPPYVDLMPSTNTSN